MNSDIESGSVQGTITDRQAKTKSREKAVTRINRKAKKEHNKNNNNNTAARILRVPHHRENLAIHDYVIRR